MKPWLGSQMMSGNITVYDAEFISTGAEAAVIDPAELAKR
jgi:hypothetical protein